MADLRLSLAIGLLTCCLGVLASVLRYDQSQSGDVNVQLHLKNIEVFAIVDDTLFGEYGDYDYADLTEKPPKPPKPSHNSTANSTAYTSHSTNTTTSKPDDILVVEDIFYNIVSNITSRPHTNITTSLPTTESTTTETTTTTTAKTVKRCGAGFYRDTLGRCRRIRRPHIPLFSLGYHNRNQDATAF